MTRVCSNNLFLRDGLSVPGLQAHIDHAQPQDLSRLHRALLYLLTVDEGAIRGIQVANENLRAAQGDLAMVAGDRRLRNLKGVVRQPADRGFFRFEVVGLPGQALAQQDESCHSLQTLAIMFGATSKSRVLISTSFR